jgi:hypothetical protein
VAKLVRSVQIQIRSDLIFSESQIDPNPTRPETRDDPNSDEPKTQPDPNLNDPKPEMIRNPTRSEPEWSEIQDDPISDNPKPDPIQTRTTWSLRWPEMRWSETPPDPILKILIWLYYNYKWYVLSQVQFHNIYCVFVLHIYLITLKLYRLNIKLLFINSNCTCIITYLINK